MAYHCDGDIECSNIDVIIPKIDKTNQFIVMLVKH